MPRLVMPGLRPAPCGSRNRRPAPGSSWRRRARWRPPAGSRRRQARCRRRAARPCTPFSWQKRSTAATSSVVDGQHHGERQPAIGGQRVGLEGAALVLGDDQGLARDEAAETREDLLAAGRIASSGFGNAMVMASSLRNRRWRLQGIAYLNNKAAFRRCRFPIM